MTVPCAIVVDYFYGGISPSIGQVVGGLLVTLGVICVSIDGNILAVVQRYFAG